MSGVGHSGVVVTWPPGNVGVAFRRGICTGQGSQKSFKKPRFKANLDVRRNQHHTHKQEITPSYEVLVSSSIIPRQSLTLPSAKYLSSLQATLETNPRLHTSHKQHVSPPPKPPPKHNVNTRCTSRKKEHPFNPPGRIHRSIPRPQPTTENPPIPQSPNPENLARPRRGSHKAAPPQPANNAAPAHPSISTASLVIIGRNLAGLPAAPARHMAKLNPFFQIKLNPSSEVLNH
jgi:hypothetical protein